MSLRPYSQTTINCLQLQQHVVPAEFHVKPSASRLSCCQVSMLDADKDVTVKLVPGPPNTTLRVFARRMDVQVIRISAY